MKVFNAYAAYYDLLYNEKDYKKEVDYVHRLINKNCPGSKTILELGCGTGLHACEFTKLGYEVTGIDYSKEMISRAENRKIKGTVFSHGDIRSVRLNKKFDVVVSLFHVMSYQTKNQDLFSVFKTVKTHLKKGGVFIFDCWYGPGFLTDLPVTREKKFQNEKIDVHRISTSQIDIHKNVVEVNFEVRVMDKASSQVKMINEKHLMRYMFTPELNILASPMKIAHVYDWMYEKLTRPRYITVICKNDV